MFYLYIDSVNLLNQDVILLLGVGVEINLDCFK